MLKRPYLKDANRCSTPVYTPGESYSFVINTEDLFSDPLPGNLRLEIADRLGVVIKTNVGNLLQAFPFTGSVLYILYSTFAFPYGVANGYYRFQIRSAVDDEVKLRSRIFLVENEITNNTLLVECWDESERYGVPYNLMLGPDGNSPFVQRFRLGLSQVDIQFESEKTTYRNASNRQMRTITSDRDTVLRIEARGLDEPGQEALSAVLEHNSIVLDGLQIEPKTALTIATNLPASQNKSTFDAYANDVAERHGIFGEHGDIIIMCGDAVNIPFTATPRPDLVDNFVLLTDDNYVLYGDDGQALIQD